MNSPLHGDTTPDLKWLSDRYADNLWEPGRHRTSSVSFVMEIHEFMVSNGFAKFDDTLIDMLVSHFRSKKNRNSTINRKLAALYKLLKKAERNGLIHRLPSYVRLQEKNGRIRFFTKDEEIAFFSEMAKRNEDHFRLCVFLVDTGARVGEALALKWSDVTPDRATFWITKSGRSRTIPLTLRAGESVFSKNIPIGPFANIKYPSFLYDWNAVKKALGLEHDKQLVPHTLRHTCASRLVQAGIDLRRVQTFLGHQTIQMTLRYAHLATNDLNQCVVALEDFGQDTSARERTRDDGGKTFDRRTPQPSGSMDKPTENPRPDNAILPRKLV